MVERKRKSCGEASPDKDYLALVTYLPLKHFWKVASFFRMVTAIQAQLSRSRGLVGYSLLAKALRKRFWTFLVWEDEEALMGFVLKVPQRYHGVAKGPIGQSEICSVEDSGYRRYAELG